MKKAFILMLGMVLSAAQWSAALMQPMARLSSRH